MDKITTSIAFSKESMAAINTIRKKDRRSISAMVESLVKSKLDDLGYPIAAAPDLMHLRAK